MQRRKKWLENIQVGPRRQSSGSDLSLLPFQKVSGCAHESAMTKAEEVLNPAQDIREARARGIYRRAPHSRRAVPAQPGTHCRPFQRDRRAGSRLRALSRKLRPAHHVHACGMQWRSFARRGLCRLQPESGSHSAPGSFSNHSCRLRDRIHLPYSRYSTKTGRMAASCLQYRDGAAAFRSSFVRHERIPGSCGFVPASRGILSQPPQAIPPSAPWTKLLPRKLRDEEITLVQEVREGKFQKHLAAATAASAFFSGIEALYSHYKNNFKYKAQWSPIVIAGLLIGAALGSIWSPKVAKKLLPAASALAIADGAVGFFYHARGVTRRPGGLKHPLYNVMYGPPIFAPLLFAACGFLGILASMFRRER